MIRINYVVVLAVLAFVCFSTNIFVIPKLYQPAAVSEDYALTLETNLSIQRDNNKSKTYSPGAEDTVHRPRVAYVTLSYGNDYCPALTCALNVQEVLEKHSVMTKDGGATHDNHVAININHIDVIIMRVGKEIPNSELPTNVKQRIVNATRAQGKHQWTHTYSKFWVATWYEYDAVIFLDSDVLLLKPLTELTNQAISVPGSIVVPRAYWLPQPFATSGTFALSPLKISQTEESTHSTAAISDLFSVLSGKSGAVGSGEMDWLNEKLANKVSLVSGWFTLLCGEFSPRDGIYRHFGKEFGLSLNETLHRAPLVHFVATWKPWAKGIQTANKEDRTPELEFIYDRWNQVKKRACVKGY